MGFAFPERHIFNRSNGTVHYIYLSPIRQSLMALGAVGFVCWTFFVTAHTVHTRPQVVVTQEEIERDQARRNDVLRETRARTQNTLAQVQERGRQFDSQTRELQARHTLVRSLIEQVGLNDQRAQDRLDADKRHDLIRRNDGRTASPGRR